MVKRRFDSSAGRIEVVARDEEAALTARSLAEVLHARSAEHERVLERIDFGGVRAWVKAGPLRGRERWRRRANELLLRAPPPRVREHANLAWLRERLFLVPEPLAAAVVRRRGAAVHQMLVTAEIVGAISARDVLRDGTESAKRALLVETAAETARLHALHFVHGDLDPRNLLVCACESGGNVWFLDCWRGGPRIQARGPACDLGCFLVRAPEWIGRELQREFLDVYREARATQGKPVARWDAFVREVGRERGSLARRWVARPQERAGERAPVIEWPLP